MSHRNMIIIMNMSSSSNSMSTLSSSSNCCSGTSNKKIFKNIIIYIIKRGANLKFIIVTMTSLEEINSNDLQLV